jgi:hypothetical protein
MYRATLRRIREKVRNKEYIVTLHADEQMDEDDLTIFDVEEVILTGEIFERQKDRDSAEWKYLIRGQTLSEERAVVVTRLSVTSKLVIITVYVE